MRLKYYLAVASILMWGAHSDPELLLNPGFESGLANWDHAGFTMTADTSQHHSGTTSAKCTRRTQSWNGPGQLIHIKPGGRYAFSIYIRLVSDLPGSMYQTAAVSLDLKRKDIGADEYISITHRPFLTAADGWVQLGADFAVPNREYTQAKIYVEGLAPHFDFYVDDASLTEIAEETNWKAEANSRIDSLRKSNIHFKVHVRGVCTFWAKPGDQPIYARTLTGQALKDAVDQHIKYITGITKGKLSHWNVDNELIHFHFFETNTGDQHYTYHMFQAVHAADPTPRLFLNDFSVVVTGDATIAYLDQIKRFKAANVGLGGVGIQSHFPHYQAPDPTLMKYRLDLLAQPGVPLWITELDLAAPDENTRA